MSSRSEAGPLKRFLMLQVVPLLALAILKALDLTWRYRETDRKFLDQALQDERPVVGASLHGRTFLLLRYMSRPNNGHWLAMCSKSLDGDAMTKVEEALGFEVIRGSSGRDGLQAIVDMIRRVRENPGLCSCLAIDGSRGPRGHAQGGIIALAQRTGGLIVPVTASARPAKILSRTWDRTLLPLPFAKLEIVYGQPFDVPAKLKAEEFEELRADLELKMENLQNRADELSGLRDSAPFKEPAAPTGNT